MNDLTGKTAVITGSTSGIGLGLARGFAQAGANVVINGLGDPDEIEKTRSELDAEAQGTIAYDGADMTNPDLGPDHKYQHELSFSHGASGGAGNESQRLGQDHQYRVGTWLSSFSV